MSEKPRSPRRRSPPFSPLYPILDASLETFDSLTFQVAALARAGCRLFQLRAKELSSEELHAWALAASRAARDHGIQMIVNDRVDVALLSGAHGVHLGDEDLSPEAAREILGGAAIIGLSTHGVEEARLAASAPVDYVAIGPIFETSTKRSSRRTLGVEGARAARLVVAKPLVAIGGITLETAPSLFEAGIDGVAVISALKTGEDLESLARRWLELPKSEDV